MLCFHTEHTLQNTLFGLLFWRVGSIPYFMKGIKSDPYLKMYWTPLIINATNSRRVVTIPLWTTETFNLHGLIQLSAETLEFFSYRNYKSTNDNQNWATLSTWISFDVMIRSWWHCTWLDLMASPIAESLLFS